LTRGYLSRARLLELLGEAAAARLVAKYAEHGGRLRVPRASDAAAREALVAVVGPAGASALIEAHGGRSVGLPRRARPLAVAIGELHAAGLTANRIAERLGCTVGYCWQVTGGLHRVSTQ
jgi:hypothetical protein